MAEIRFNPIKMDLYRLVQDREVMRERIMYAEALNNILKKYKMKPMEDYEAKPVRVYRVAVQAVVNGKLQTHVELIKSRSAEDARYSPKAKVMMQEFRDEFRVSGNLNVIEWE